MNLPRPKTTQFNNWYCLLIGILCLPFLYAAFFTFPGGDDFARALKAKHLFDVIGGFDEMARAWWKWSGRYTHHFIVVFLGDAAMGRMTYALACIGNMALYLISIYGICREITPESSKSTSLFFGFFLLFALLCSHGTLSGTWFLLTDILSLGIAGGFTLMYIWSLCHAWNVPTLTRHTKIFCIASAVLAAGCYEYSAVMVVIISITAVLLAYIHAHPYQRFFYHLCSISVVCLLVSFLAHGNFHRQNRRNVTLELIFSQLASAWAEWKEYILPVLLSPLYLCIAIWAAWIAPLTRYTAKRPVSCWMVFLYCCFMAAGFMALLTIVHALSDVTVADTPKIGANFSIFISFIFGFALLYCRPTLRLSSVQYVPKSLVLAICLLLLCLTPNWQRTLWAGICGEYLTYAKIQERRLALYAAKQKEALTIAPLTSCPFPVCSGDPVLPEPRQWPTKYVSRLYGLQSVQTTAPDTKQLVEVLKQNASLNWKPTHISEIKQITHSAATPLGQNITYEFDWLLIEFNKANPLPKQIKVLVISNPWLIQAISLPDIWHKPSWLHIQPAQSYEANMPWLVVQTTENICALPVTLNNTQASVVYITFDQKTYYRIPETLPEGL